MAMVFIIVIIARVRLINIKVVSIPDVENFGGWGKGGVYCTVGRVDWPEGGVDWAE